MTETITLPWPEANQHYLTAHLDRIRQMLIRHVEPASDDRTAPAQSDGEPLPTMGHPHPAALDILVDLFDLSPFERDLLLLCAGMDLDAAFPGLCAAAQGDPQRRYPTFSLALAALPGAHWSALTPDAPLRRWQLLELEGGRTLTHSPLRIDERILHVLAGAPHLDERLAGLVRLLPPPGELVSSHRAVAEEMAATWARAAGQTELPVVQLCGPEIEGKRALAAAACAHLGLNLYLLPAAAIPAEPGELAKLLRLWEREAILSDSALLLDCDAVERTDHSRESAIARLVEAGLGLLIISGRERRGPWQRPLLTFDVDKPTTAEQRAIWRATLGETGLNLNGQIDRLVSQFNLSGLTIQAATTGARGRLSTGDDDAIPTAADLGAALWDICRVQVRPRLDDLAQRIEPAATWDDLILPEAQRDLLREIAIHVRQRSQVYKTWGFISKGQHGLGISALFAGVSGTGKTMAAEVLAGELQLDLYRIDLSAVVSKYIGETEKNLSRVFDAAEEGGAILLFDEADALFGKRSEVKDSHDRHANIEVSYLLQRMEAYRGLAILTSNLKDALDTAFLRRIRFIVQFPFPNEAERAAIWQRIFPAATPTEALDLAKLARLNVAGGNIRNIALNAAFLAADADQAVSMVHLLRAARREYGKLEKKLTEVEIKGWANGHES